MEVGKALRQYVPAMVLERLDAEAGARPWAEAVSGAILFADVSGSTALAERLAERGPAGAEELSRILNAFFGNLIEAVHAHGGDVVKFAGDGLFAFWRSSGEDAGTAALHAAAAGLAAQSALRADDSAGDARLSMRIGLGAGSCVALAVGTAGERLDFILTGAPVAAACEVEREAQPGELVASAQAWSLIESYADGVAAGGGGVRVRAVASPIALSPTGADATDRPPGAIARLRCFAPPTVLDGLESGHGDWLAELRYITALFVQLPDWGSVRLEDAQATMAAVHSAVDRYGGQVIRLGMDASGPIVKAAFGLPPQAHEDDPARAVQAALEMRAELEQRGVRGAIGIAGGRTFCGEVGNDRRREYTTVGAVVHRAARLMQNAGGGILCDDATRAACAERIDFLDREALALKGIAGPVGASRPRGRRRSAVAAALSLVGRVAERAQLLEWLARPATGAARLTVIEGEAGLGKSRLVGDVITEATARGVSVLPGGGDAVETNTPYHAWRPILARLVGYGGDDTPPAALVRTALAALGDERLAGAPPASLAPLLNAVLGAESSADDATARITGEARADVTHELILRLLQRAAGGEAVLVVIEDAHWLDSASWALLELMSARVRPLHVLIATRPLPASSQPVLHRLLRADNTEVVRLEQLGADESAQLVANRLGVRSVSPSILSFIFARAAGHPFFTEELAYALRDTGVLHVRGEECRLLPQAGDLAGLDLPRTVEATLTSRMDLLETRQQLLLKVASVFGQAFSAAALRDLHPLDAEKPSLERDLALLEERELIQRRGVDAFAFKHAITRDVAYGRLAFTQRRQLHRGAAEWYEGTQGGDLRALYPLLAHHWSRAVDPQHPDGETCARAVETLERAGEMAIESYANGEAVQFLEEALRLEPLLAGERESRRRGRWHRHLADANNRLGKIPEAIGHALAALEQIDRPFPRGTPRRYAAIAGQLGRQVWHRIAPARGGGLRGSTREQALDTAHLYELLGLMWYVTLDVVPATLANLRALNLAERAGPSPELATSSAMIGLSAGVLLGPKYSEHYFRTGLGAASAVGDRYGHGRVCYTRALVHTGDACWREADADYAEALSTFTAIGDARWRDIASIQLASTAFLRRRYRDARRLYEAAAQSPRERGDVQAQAWVSIGLASCLVVEGRMNEALEAWDGLTSWLANNLAHLADRGSELVMHGARALANYRLERPDAALESIEAALRVVRESQALTCYVLPGYTQTAETCLRLWERNVAPGRIERLAAEAVANLGRYGKLYRLGRPAAALWRGDLDWLRGRQRRARAAWGEALALACELDLAHEEGLAHYEIGRRLEPGSAERGAHLERAAEIFTAAGLPLELADVERARGSAAPAVSTPMRASGSPV